MKIALVIFTKNERKNSEIVFPKIPQNIVDSIYIVDGNSTDGTKEFYIKNKVKVFGQRYSGIGGAYESAFKNTQEDALIFFHPDGNMNVNDIKIFVKLLNQGSEFIIASRMIREAYNEEDSQIFKPRKWFNQIIGLITNILWGDNKNNCSDIVQGYRAITRSTYQKLGIKVPSAIAPEFEQVIRALKLNIKITEFPTKEGLRLHGNTTMPSFKTGLGNIKVLIKEIFD